MKRFDVRTYSTAWIIVAGLACAAVAGENGYTLSRSSTEAGGGKSSSAAGYDLTGTVGGSQGSTMTGNAYELNDGFLYPLLPADCDEDGLVGPMDYSSFELCFTGPSGSVPESCACHDADGSGAIDLHDFARAQAAYSGTPGQ
jgi:hypothetical protein